MSRHKFAAVFYIGHTFELGFKKIAESAGNRSNGCNDHDMNSEPFKVKAIKGNNTNNNYTKNDPSDCSFPGFLWRNF